MNTKNVRIGLTLPIITFALVFSVGTGPNVAERVTVSGKVTFRGATPSSQLIDMGSNDYCATAQRTAQITSQIISTGPDSGLRDVVVYVKEGLSAAGESSNNEPALLDQKDCTYTPSVIAMQTSQPLVVRNSDATLHNVHVYASENRGFNIGQPFQGIESNRSFDNPEVGIEVKCDVHGWMTGSIAVFDHSFFSVTDDDGNFSIANLPPGDYVIAAWHHTLGTATQSLTVTTDTADELHFEFES